MSYFNELPKDLVSVIGDYMKPKITIFHGIAGEKDQQPNEITYCSSFKVESPQMDISLDLTYPADIFDYKNSDIFTFLDKIKPDQTSDLPFRGGGNIRNILWDGQYFKIGGGILKAELAKIFHQWLKDIADGKAMIKPV